MVTWRSSATGLWLSLATLVLLIIADVVSTASDSDIDTWNVDNLEDGSLLQVQYGIIYGGTDKSPQPAHDQKNANAASSIDSAAKVDTSVQDKLILKSAITIDSAANRSTEHGAIQMAIHSTENKLISVVVNHPEMQMSAISISSAAHVNTNSFQTWVPIMVVGIIVVILIGFADVSGPQSCAAWLKGAVLLDLPADRRNSYYLFGLAQAMNYAAIVIGTELKTAVFFDVVGAAQEPIAKSVELFVLLPLLILYSIAVTALPSTRMLVIVVNAFYTAIILFLTVMIQTTHKPTPWLAWALYFAVEVKIICAIPMVWSVIADVSTAELSKKAYPFIVFALHVGGMGGSFVTIEIDRFGGQVGVMWMQTLMTVVVGACTWGGVSAIENTPEAEVELPPPKQPQDSGGGSLMSVALKRIWDGGEGLWLLLSRPYLFMVYFVSQASSVIKSIVHYELAVLVQAANPNPNDQVTYYGWMDLITNVLVVIISLTGTRKLIELLNISKVLALLPLIAFGCIASLCVDYKLPTATISYIVLQIVILTVEAPFQILYVRTSRDIKYKAKTWSDMFGANLMSILGTQINLWVNDEKASCFPNCFSPITTFILSGSWVMIWLSFALTVGWQFQELDAADDIIS